MQTPSSISSPSLSVAARGSFGARCLLRRGVQRPGVMASSVVAQSVSLTHVRHSVAVGGCSGRKNRRPSFSSVSGLPGNRFVACVSPRSSGLLSRFSQSNRCCANHSFERTAEKLRFSVPSALRAPAAAQLKRSACYCCRSRYFETHSVNTRDI